MKSDGKKGLSIGVIIVIVIVTLVIAMLATVFTIRLVSAKLKEPVVKKAQESAAMQNANNAWMDYMAENFNKANYQENICIKSTVDGNDYYFHVVNGEFKTEAVENHSASTAHAAGTAMYKVNAEGKLETV